MEKVKKISFKNAEIVVHEDKTITIIERTKDGDVFSMDFASCVEDFKGIQNLAISISTKSEIIVEDIEENEE